jgi:hypothetical protein
MELKEPGWCRHCQAVRWSSIPDGVQRCPKCSRPLLFCKELLVPARKARYQKPYNESPRAG